jgi:dTDP-4-dehydrorhamnose reductase
MKKILITGGSGMVGYNLLRNYHKKFELFSLYNKNISDFDGITHIQVDITDKKQVLGLKDINPDIIIHCAALTKISKCENNSELANDINVKGTSNIRDLAHTVNAKLVYISTDAVFDGGKGNYSEKDITNPKTVYGKTKLMGEKVCLEYPNSLVIRTNVFGESHMTGRCGFVDDLITSLSNGKKYGAYSNVEFSPIYVGFMAKIILDMVSLDARGVFNIALSKLSKFDFANVVAEVFGYNADLVENVISKDKMNLTLNNKKMVDFLKIEKIPTIKEMLVDFRNQYSKNFI